MSKILTVVALALVVTACDAEVNERFDRRALEAKYPDSEYINSPESEDWYVRHKDGSVFHVMIDASGKLYATKIFRKMEMSKYE